MLHILFVILKILGIILAVILGILLLLVCIVLFVPICYKGEAESAGTLEDIQAHVQAVWLFGLVKAAVDFRNKSPDFYIRIAWIKIGGRTESISEEEESEHEGNKEYEKCGEEHREALEKEEKERKASGSEKHREIKEEHSKDYEGSAECAEIPKEESEVQKEIGEDVPKICEERTKRNKRPAKERRRKISLVEKLKEQFQKYVQKIRQAIEKFKCTIQELCGKIEKTSEKKDRLTAFITDKTHTAALGKGKKELMKFLGHLSPKAFQADIHYGFEDPSLTGKVLAGFGVLYPFLGDHARITPDFQEKVLEGSLRVKGRIYVMHVAALAVKLLFDSKVRRTIKDVRNFKL